MTVGIVSMLRSGRTKMQPNARVLNPEEAHRDPAFSLAATVSDTALAAVRCSCGHINILNREWIAREFGNKEHWSFRCFVCAAKLTLGIEDVPFISRS
jgi:hypothetical protein